MKTKYFLFIFLVFLSSCFAPRDRKATVKSQQASLPYSSPSSYSADDPYIKPLDLPTSLPSEATHCAFSTDGIAAFEKFSPLIGRYNICQSKTNDTEIFFQLKSPIYDSRVCLVPTYHNSGSYTSIYIGEPKCIFMTDAKNIQTIHFLKNRLSPSGQSTYAQYPITGVMIMKDKSYFFPSPFGVELNAVEAYKRCSQMLDLGNSSYCQAFKSLGEYTYITFND